MKDVGNIMKKALNLILIAGLAMAGLPAGAQELAPNTIWGEVPQSVASNAARAVLQDTSGRVAATVPVIDGKFAFPDVVPGQYVVVVQDAAGNALATSHGISFTITDITKAIFDATRVPAAAVVGGGGLSTTAWILIGAAAVGITTAIVIATNDDEGTASPSR
jgi:hypothetical protein